VAAGTHSLLAAFDPAAKRDTVYAEPAETEGVAVTALPTAT
jgi:hypothetical protein